MIIIHRPPRQQSRTMKIQLLVYQIPGMEVVLDGSAVHSTNWYVLSSIRTKKNYQEPWSSTNCQRSAGLLRPGKTRQARFVLISKYHSRSRPWCLLVISLDSRLYSHSYYRCTTVVLYPYEYFSSYSSLQFCGASASGYENSQYQYLKAI